VGALTESASARKASDYWAQTKKRMIEKEGAEQLLTNCQQLELPGTDGKRYRTDCASIETMFRIIQSIPSRKAEPFKQWLAKVGFERIRETAEPSRLARRMVQTYRDLGYSDDWIDDRLQQAVADAQWDEELGGRGVKEQSKAPVRAVVHEEAFGTCRSRPGSTTTRAFPSADRTRSACRTNPRCERDARTQLWRMTET
jgi:hypothetical protein